MQMILGKYDLVVSKSSIELMEEEINQRKLFWDFYYEMHYFDLPLINHQLQERLLTKIEQEVGNVSKKKVKNIIRLALQPSSYGTSTFDLKIVRSLQKDPLFVAISERLQQISTFHSIAPSHIFC